MNKKIIGAILVGLLAVGGFTLYTVYNNNKVEEEQTAMAKDAAVQKEIEETPVANEKNDAGEYVNGEPDVAIQVHDFFDKCMQYSFNIPDTKNIPTEVTEFQKANFNPEYLPIIDKFYTGYESLELINYTIKNIKQTASGWEISYVAVTKDNGKEVQSGTEEKPIIAIVSKDIKLVQFYTSY